MASYDFVNYSLRPSKTVERKLMFEILATIGRILDFPAYRYIGFGSMWFIDFVMAHKILAINDMYSIEGDVIGAVRARFNSPFACVKVVEGFSSDVLPTLQLDEHPSVVWLDYDTGLEGPVLSDLALLCRTAIAGSVIMVSINAHKGSLPQKDENDVPFSSDREKLFSLAGDLIPAELPLGTMTASKYPSFLSALLFAHARSAMRTAGRDGDALLPIFNLEYKDNVPMLTVGFAILERAQVESVKSSLCARHFDHFASETACTEIGVPPLTFKEKAFLDQLMPSGAVPTPEAVAALGFKLKPSQVAAYHRFYRYYPMFGEVAL